MKKMLMILILCNICRINAAVADLVLFSFDRPLQTYALLESIEKYVRGIGETIVIVRSSDDGYKHGYSIVRQRFPKVKFFEQGEKPKEDFKPLTLKATFNSPSPYVFFGVDDIVVKDYVDISGCIEMLERTRAFGFYLRLGEHLNFSYTMNAAQKVPLLSHIQDDVFAWTFGQGTYDWGYPHTVDMTVYRKKDIEKLFRSMGYYSPNTLEGEWATHGKTIMEKRGLCFKNSKVVNLPLNKVQTDYDNISMDISPAFLQKKFLDGYKMDIKPLFQVKNRSAHMEYAPTFVLR